MSDFMVLFLNLMKPNEWEKTSLWYGMDSLLELSSFHWLGQSIGDSDLLSECFLWSDIFLSYFINFTFCDSYLLLVNQRKRQLDDKDINPVKILNPKTVSFHIQQYVFLYSFSE